MCERELDEPDRPEDIAAPADFERVFDATPEPMAPIAADAAVPDVLAVMAAARRRTMANWGMADE